MMMNTPAKKRAGTGIASNRKSRRSIFIPSAAATKESFDALNAPVTLTFKLVEMPEATTGEVGATAKVLTAIPGLSEQC